MARIYKVNEIDNDRFYMVPKSLFGNERYAGLSLEAKILYAVLRDRMELSRKNGWVMESGEIFLLYTREHLMELLECSKPTITKAMKQLSQYELIIEKRQGLGKPNIIYICYVVPKSNDTNRSKNSLLQEEKNIPPSDTDFIDTENNYNHNGCHSEKPNDNSHSFLSYLTISDDCRKSVRYYFDKYEDEFDIPHPRLKPDQIKRVCQVIQSFINENDIDYDSLAEIIDHHFNRRIDSDYNINHFATEGILTNLFFDAVM